MPLKHKGHSPLGASSMSRWAACPGSVKASGGLKQLPSPAAQEGTNAHTVGEHCLEFTKNVFDLVDQDFHDTTGKFVVTDDMADAVDVYLQYIDSRISKGDTLLIEYQFNLDSVYPDLWGMNDACIYKPKEKKLIVVDYKHGRGVSVEANNNLQLLYYALGAVTNNFSQIKEIEMVIVQPRCPHPAGSIRSWTIDASTLIDWIPDLIDAATATEDPNAPRIPGETQCRFCLACGTPRCPESYEKALAVAKVEFSPEGKVLLPEATSLTGEKAAQLFNELPVLENWIKRFRAFQHAEAEHGRCAPGLKLVQKRATRKFKDEQETVNFLLETKLDTEDMYQTKLLSPAQIEKKLDKHEKEQMKEYVIKQSSGTTLVPEADKREAVKNAIEQDFSPVGKVEEFF